MRKNGIDWRDRRFWACGLLFAGLLVLVGYFEFRPFRYHPFPFLYVFHALTLFPWLSGLYCRWSGRWRPGDRRVWGGLVLLCALPQLPMCMISYVSWVLLGVSLAMGMGGIFLK